MGDSNNHNQPDTAAAAMMQDFARIFISAIQQTQFAAPPPTTDIATKHIKLPSPDTYNGIRDPVVIDNWIYSIENHQHIYNMDEVKTYWFAKALLKDSAQSWIRYLEDPDTAPIPPTTWSELKNILKAKFRPTNDEDLARDVLVTIVQRKSIREYVDEFMDAIMAVKNIADSESTDRFMRGLKDTALVAKIRAIPKAERSLDKVIDEALAHEFAHNPSASRNLYSSSSSARTTTRDDPMELDAIQGYRRSGSSFASGKGSKSNGSKSFSSSGTSKPGNRSSPRAVRRPDLECKFCGKVGHLQDRCFARAAEIIAAAEGLVKGNKSGGRGSLNFVDDDNKDDTHFSYAVDVITNDVGSMDVDVVDIKDNDAVSTADNDAIILPSSSSTIANDSIVEHDVTASAQDVVSESAGKEDVLPRHITSNPVIESIPVIVVNDDDETKMDNIVCEDSKYLSTLLNATMSSVLPLFQANVFLTGTNSSSTKTVHCLIDNGASENYISSRIANLTECERVKVRGRIVEAAGGNVSPITDKVEFDLDLQGHCSSMSAFVFDTKFDVILGRSFLKNHNPKPDWFDDTWELSCCSSGKTIVINPTFSKSTSNESSVPAPPQLNYLVSHLQAEDMLKEDGTESCFLYLIDDDKKDGLANVGKESVVWTKQLMKDFPSVFKDKLPGLPPIREEFSHVINVPDDVTPINRPPFRMSPAELDELQKQLKELSSLGFIRPSTSPWGAPVLFVKKKDGTMRMCIDYRAINKLTIRNSTPLPRIDECLDRMQGASWFTSLDLRSGYHQIRIKDSDILRSAFNTRYGKWEFLVLPFGLSNAPPSYQSWMNNILKDCLDKFALIYLDDACIFSKTLEEHIEHVRHVIGIFEKHGLVVNLKKCEFGKRELEFLGFRISKAGILPSVSKVKAIQDWTRPTNVQEVRQFLGLAQHYRRFCPSFSSIAAPLTELTHGTGAKKRAVLWNEKCETSFLELKRMLTSPPILRLPDMNKPFRIETDASDFAVGAVLLQQDESSSEWLPIAYESKKLSAAEQKFPAQERELIAIMCYIQIATIK